MKIKPNNRNFKNRKHMMRIMLRIRTKACALEHNHTHNHQYYNLRLFYSHVSYSDQNRPTELSIPIIIGSYCSGKPASSNVPIHSSLTISPISVNLQAAVTILFTYYSVFAQLLSVVVINLRNNQKFLDKPKSSKVDFNLSQTIFDVFASMMCT